MNTVAEFQEDMRRSCMITGGRSFAHAAVGSPAYWLLGALPGLGALFAFALAVRLQASARVGVRAWDRHPVLCASQRNDVRYNLQPTP